jgi:hypothetical protein
MPVSPLEKSTIIEKLCRFIFSEVSQSAYNSFELVALKTLQFGS